MTIRQALTLCFSFLLVFFAGCKEGEQKTEAQLAVTESKAPVPAVHELPLPESLPESLRRQKSLKVFPNSELLPLIKRAQLRLIEESQLKPTYHEEPVEGPKGKPETQTKPSHKKGDVKKVTKKKPPVKMKKVFNYDILLAVTHPAHQEIRVIKVPFLSTVKERQKNARAHESNFVVAWEVRNGCNTPFEVSQPKGYVVLALRCLIGEQTDTPESLVYTPHNDFLDIEELRKEGYQYLMRTMDAARKELKEQGVMSQAFPRELAADVVPRSVAFRLALIEHMEPSLINKVPTEDLVNKVLVTIASNKGAAYLTSRSGKGAYGLLQFMPGTYKTIVSRYPKAKLIPDFKEGMRDHVNAAKATLLLFDDDLSTLCAKFGKDGCLMVRNHPQSLAEYLAAAYNGSSGKAALAIRDRKENESWRSGLFSETILYLDKLDAVNKVLK